MPEILRGSFGQLVTSSLLHGQIPVKKFTYLQLVGKNLTGAEADRLGIVSHAVPAAELEAATLDIARGIASRHLAALEHAKIAVQMGRDLSLAQAIQLDQLVGSRLQQAMDPTANLGEYLGSQKGGPNPGYKRPDV
jgi:enoyl-CoA hydratase/carnithine racemase